MIGAHTAWESYFCFEARRAADVGLGTALVELVRHGACDCGAAHQHWNQIARWPAPLRRGGFAQFDQLAKFALGFCQGCLQSAPAASRATSNFPMLIIRS